MKLVVSRFGNQIKYAATRTTEFSAIQACLKRVFGDSVFVIDLVRRPGHGDIVILSSVDQIVIAARSLTVNRELRSVSELRSAGRGRHAGKKPAQVIGVERRNRKFLDLLGRKISAANRVARLQ